MKDSIKNPRTELDLNSAGKVLSTGAAAGIAIAAFTGKKTIIGGIMGAGLSLLITGLIIALEDDGSEESHEYD